MTFLKIDKKDRRWLAGWLRGNLICLLVAGSLLVALRVESTIPVIRVTQARGEHSSGMDDRLSTGKGISVAPLGWRRTSNGWEQASRWRLPQSQPLGELILMQKEREPLWVRACLEWLRELPPLTFALFQLSAIATILWGATMRKKTRSKISGRVSMESIRI